MPCILRALNVTKNPSYVKIIFRYKHKKASEQTSITLALGKGIINSILVH